MTRLTPSAETPIASERKDATGQMERPASSTKQNFWQGFRKGMGQGAMAGSAFLGVGTYVLLFQHRWFTALGTFLIGSVMMWLGLKIWIQESDDPFNEDSKSFSELFRESEMHEEYWLEMIENCSAKELAGTIVNALISKTTYEKGYQRRSTLADVVKYIEGEAARYAQHREHSRKLSGRAFWDGAAKALEALVAELPDVTPNRKRVMTHEKDCSSGVSSAGDNFPK